MKVIVSRMNERTNEEMGRGRGMNEKERKEQDCRENARKKVRTYNTVREQYHQFGYQNSEQYGHYVHFDYSIARSKALGI